jgi:hypothetical protein
MLLVSPNFLASQFILNVELPSILDRAKVGGVIPFWCLVTDCLWSETPLAKYQAAHNPTKVWIKLGEGELDTPLKKVCTKIKEVFEQSAAPLPATFEVPPPLPARPTVSAVVEPRVLPGAELEAGRL